MRVSETQKEQSDPATSGVVRIGEGDKPGVRKVGIVASLFGTALEYYDFSLFGIYSAIIFNRLFFDPSDAAAASLQALGLFSVGFLFRPIGGALFASLGDRFGRRVTLIVTLVTMGAATFLIGTLPTYQQIGVIAPLSLVFLRLLQAAGAGAELLGAVSYISEDAGRKGFMASIPTMGSFMGSVLASLVVAVVALLPQDQFLAWGWRLPFLASVAIVAIGLLIRTRLGETKAFTEVVEAKAVSPHPLRDVLATDYKALFNVFVGVLGWAPFPLFFQVFVLSYAQTTIKLPDSAITYGLLISSLVAIPVLPLFGALSDRIGQKAVMIGGYLFLAVFAGAPFFWLAKVGDGWGFWLAMTIGFSIGNTAIFAPQQAWLVGMFDVRHRLSGMVVAREAAMAVGGLSPVILGALAAIDHGSVHYISIFLAVSAVVGAVAVGVSTPASQRMKARP